MTVIFIHNFIFIYLFILKGVGQNNFPLKWNYFPLYVFFQSVLINRSWFFRILHAPKTLVIHKLEFNNWYFGWKGHI